MTIKQKQNIARFKKVQAEAKKLRSKNKKLSQAQAVKQAWAIQYSKEEKTKVGKVKKSAVKVKRGRSGELHTDTKSHNVNIRVVSGWKKGKTAIIEKGEKPYKKLRNIRVTRNTKKTLFDKPGTFKSFTVVSGIGNIGENFTRVNNDINGNPRYVVHFLEFLNDEERISIPWTKKYEYAVKKAKLIGGKKYDNKSYGGGIIFQSYNIADTWKKIQELKNKNVKIKI